MLLRLMFLEPTPTARHDVLFTCCCASCFWNCFRSWPERLEPSPAARTRIFRENLGLPDSGWPRFVRMFDLSSAQGFLAVAAGGESQPGFPAPLIQRGRKPSCFSFSGRTFAFHFILSRDKSFFRIVERPNISLTLSRFLTYLFQNSGGVTE